MELIVCLSSSLLVILLTVVQYLVACCLMYYVTSVWVPASCLSEEDASPYVKMLSSCRIVARFVSIIFCCVDMCGRGQGEK